MRKAHCIVIYCVTFKKTGMNDNKYVYIMFVSAADDVIHV